MNLYTLGVYIAALAMIGAGLAIHSLAAAMVVVGGLIYADILMGAYVDAIKSAVKTRR